MVWRNIISINKDVLDNVVPVAENITALAMRFSGVGDKSCVLMQD